MVVHDIWEIRDVQSAVTDWMEQPFANDPRWHEYSRRVKDIILKEETVFMIKKFGRLEQFHGASNLDGHHAGIFNEETN